MRNGGNHLRKAVALAFALAAVPVAGCGGDDAGAGSGSGSSAQAGVKRVLPVTGNTIANDSTAPGLRITKALVENNVSPESGDDVPDHLEVALQNIGDKPLDRIEVYYKITDPTRNVSEGYQTPLEGFTVAPGATRVAHFDETGAKDHYPVNKYSLYYTGKNALAVDVMAGSPGTKPATFTVRKDAAGAEAGVE